MEALPSLDRAGGAGSEGALYRHLLDLAVAEGARVVQIAGPSAILALPTGEPLFVAVAHEELAQELQREVQRLRAQVKHGRLLVVAVGGGPSVRRALLTSRARMPLRRRVHPFQLGSDGSTWRGPLARGTPELRRILARARTDPPDPAGWEERMRRSMESTREVDRELSQWRLSFNRRKPLVTAAMITTMVVVWLFEEALGGSSTVPTVVRMGAAVPQGWGEPWRLLAPVFLHGGFVHLSLNGFALWVLGRFLEQLLGSARFLVLLAVAAVAGMLLSPFPAVGASGQIWGLLIAASWFAWRGRGVLPAPLVRPLRDAMGKNLLLCLLISFVPGVAWHVHLGGGLGGLLVAALPWAARGSSPGASRAFLPGAVAATPLWGGLVAAQVQGRPWELVAAEETFQPVPLGETGLVVQVPAWAARAPVGTDGDQWGTIDHDGAVIGAWSIDLTAPPDGPEAVAAVLEEVRREYATAAAQEGWAPVTDTHVEPVDGRPTLREHYRRKDGVHLWRTTRASSDRVVTAAVWGIEGLHPGAPDWGPRVLASISP